MNSFTSGCSPDPRSGTRTLALWMSCSFRPFVLATIFCIIALLSTGTEAAAEVPTFTVCWSVYAGWNPYFYMQKSGVLKKWADKYGVVIKVQRFDYAASLDSFVAKNIDACPMTNMEALDMPASF